MSVTDEKFANVTMETPVLRSCLQGHVAVYSRRCPDVERPNEDSAGWLVVGDNTALLVVADGCGGMAAGAEASRLTVDTLLDTVRKVPSEGGSIRSTIVDGIEAANRAVRELANGAAATLIAVEVHERSVRAFHVGDSTALLVGNRGKIKLETRSHSPVAYGVEAGLIDRDDALLHEDLHLVSNVIGHEDTHIEIGPPKPMAARDTLVLGSDGLFDNLHTHEIVEIIRKGPLDSAASTLAQRARERMQQEQANQPCKPDDITFILFRAK